MEIVASDVLNNPIADLLDALDATTRGQASSVRWFLEPGAYVLDLEPQQRNVLLRLTLTRDSLHGRQGPIELEVSGSWQEILAPIWRLLKDVESGNYSKPSWPAADFARLGELKERLDRG